MYVRAEEILRAFRRLPNPQGDTPQTMYTLVEEFPDQPPGTPTLRIKWTKRGYNHGNDRVYEWGLEIKDG